MVRICMSWFQIQYISYLKGFPEKKTDSLHLVQQVLHQQNMVPTLSELAIELARYI